MSDLGSFGPGWFYNIFGISIELENSVSVVDDGEVFAIPWFSFTGKKLLFTNKDNLIKGKITLNTYNNQREVWHGGVKVSIEEYIHTLDPYVSVETKHYETIIANEEFVKGTATYDFSFPLVFPKNKIKEKISPYCRRTWCNTFNGNTFGIRHVFHVVVLRPWYTFNCQKQIFLSLHRLDQKELNLGSYDNNPVIINTTGLKETGKCSLKLNSQAFDISYGRDSSIYGRGGAKTGGGLSGTIRVTDLTDPITSIVLLLIRKEFVGKFVTNEIIEFEHTIIGYPLDDLKAGVGGSGGEEEESPREHPKSRGYWERLDLGDSNPQDTDPIKTGSVISFEIPFDGYTNLPSNTHSDSVRGFVISGDKNSHQYRLQFSLWNTLRIYPSFSYLPLLAPPGEELKPTDESKRGTNDSKDIDRSTDLEEIHIHNEEVINFPMKETDTFTVYSVLPEESVSLKYYVRLIVQESSGNRHWNTQEIYFYDSGSSPLPPYVDEISKGHNNLEAV